MLEKLNFDLKQSRIQLNFTYTSQGLRTIHIELIAVVLHLYCSVEFVPKESKRDRSHSGILCQILVI